MKKNITSKRPQALMRMGLLSGMICVAFLTANAQSLTWTGAVNNSFTLETNWNPSSDITGKDLVVPLIDPEAGPYNHPVISGTENVAINSLNIVATDNPELQPTLTVNFDNPDAEFTIATGWDNGQDYGFTGIIVKNGVFRHTRANTPRLDQNFTFFKSEGGRTFFGNPILMGGPSNSVTQGGKMYISGGVVEVGSFGRQYLDREDGQVEITGEGKLIVGGNFAQSYVESGWINGGDDYAITRFYDAVTNKTTFEAVPNEAFLILNPDRQVLAAGQDGITVKMLNTTRVQNAKSLEWKYRAIGETTYQSFSPVATGASFVPNFPASGIYFVRCEGVDENDIEISTGEVEFYVGSDKISVTPAAEIRYARVNTPLYDLTANVDGEYTNLEWKYAATPNGPYLSFDPVASEPVYNPVFGAAGNYYLVVEATIGGVLNRSSEMWYVVEDATGRNLEWTGEYSEDMKYPGNYNPVSSTHFANLTFRAIEGKPEAKLTSAGNDTINRIYVYDTTVTIDKGAGTVLSIRNEAYNEGTTIIKSGLVDSNAQYFRVPNTVDTVIVMGDAVLKARNVLVGNSGAPTQGGAIILKDNAKAYFDIIDRVHLGAETTSRIYIDDNAVLYLAGDQRSSTKTRIEGRPESTETPAAPKKIVSKEEGFAPYMLYDPIENQTIVRARDLSAFAIANDATQYVGVDSPVPTALNLENADGITSFAWYSSNSPVGPWTLIADSENVTSFNPSFASSGVHFVIAIGNGGIETSNVASIVVVGLKITPGELEMLPGQGSPLSYSLTDGVTLVSQTWFDLTVEEGEPEVLSNDATFTPAFSTLGTYTVALMATVKDEYNIQYDLVAYATIEVVDVLSSIADKLEAGEVQIYPNPVSDGNFSIKADGDFTVEIYDLRGVLVFKSNAAQGTLPVSLNGKGVFLVKVVSKGNVSVSRIVLK